MRITRRNRVGTLGSGRQPRCRWSRWHSKYSLLLGPAAAMLIVAGCSSTPAPPSTAKHPAQPTDITFATDFGLYGRQSLFFTAAKEGYYRKANLNVTIEAGNGSASTVEEVAADKAQIGFADTGTLVTALGQAALPVRLIAVIYQSTAIALQGLASPSLRTPSDLVGKTAACAAGDATQTLWPVYAASVGLKPSALTFIHVAPASFPELLATGRVQVACEFLQGKPLLEAAVHNKPIVVFSFGRLGIYGNGIIVNTNFLAAHRQAVKAFLAASLEGARYAFAHPTIAGEATLAVNPSTDVAEAAAETRLTAQLAETPTTKKYGLGYVSLSRLKHTIAVVESVEPHTRQLTVGDVYAPLS